MIHIAIETTSSRGGLALLRGDELLGSAELSEGLVHGREVVFRAGELLARADLAPRDLDGISVGLGPGSYTGSRVGVTAAKTLAWALRVPVAGISSLEVLAWSLLERGPDPGPAILAVLDARRDTFFAARFEIRGEGLERTSDDVAGTIASLGPLATGTGRITGDGARRFLEILDRESPAGERPPERLVLCEDVYPLATILGRLAAARLRDARFDLAAVHALEPEYLRPSEPERRRAAAQQTPNERPV